MHLNRQSMKASDKGRGGKYQLGIFEKEKGHSYCFIFL